MLINLTNHSKTTWSIEQIAAAEKEYNLVTDISFPQIDSNTDSNYVESLAAHYFALCIQKLSASPDKSNAVHLMGELTFCNALANKLKQKNIKVIASTTERVAVDTPSGKLSKFMFVRFREYGNE